uniref:Gypsy retrotransposon integrase-like protein 1 n=1 Tax=Nothobranchius furzeri TaxID=105023 RepID=A0A8C6KIQ6_NOTFU
MLSIVHACTEFHHYIFGKQVTVYNNHKPLEDIFKKSLLSTPMRIQRMRLRLQWYDLKTQYRRGKNMELPDTLSRAQLKCNTPELEGLECVSMLDHIAVSDEKYDELQTRTGEELQELQVRIRQGWSVHRRDVPGSIQPYWDSRSQLTVYDGVVYKGPRVVVPPSMRKYMLGLITSGTVKSKQRAREVLYWPGMSSEIEEMVRNCSKCVEFQNKLPRLPLSPTETPDLPFEQVGSDIFEFESKQYLVIVDYYSKLIEVDELKDPRSRTVIETLKAQFSRHGIPSILRTDNGSQYTAEQFKGFYESYGISHRTSSPHTPYSNGEAERAVQTVKRLWNKAPDKHLALLDYRTTPLESVSLSPEQLLMGRRPRNLLPTSKLLLVPKAHDPNQIKQRLDKSKAFQKFHYDKKRATSIPTHHFPLVPGDEVRMQPHPGSAR